MANNDALLKKLLATFRVEADEHLKAISSGLLALKKTSAGAHRAEIVESIFRDAHSLKGAARAVNLTSIESVCQPLESVFAAFKQGRLEISPPLLDLLQRTIDVLAGLLSQDAGESARQQAPVAALIRQLGDALRGTPPEAETIAEFGADGVAHPPPVAPSLAAGTVRVSTAKLDTVMCQVEELLVPRLATGQRSRELRETAATLAVWKKQRSRIQPALRLIERSLLPASPAKDARQASERVNKIGASIHEQQALVKLLEYMEDEQVFIKALDDRLTKLKKSAAHDQRTLTGMTEGLLHDVKEMQLLPFASLLEILPRFARELAREQGKEIDLVFRGGEIEIDRRLLDEMKDPLIHLLRNSIDHGIEKPALRRERQKPPSGTIGVTISQQDSGKVEIGIVDDGAGIDAASVKAAAGRLGMVSSEAAQGLGETEALALVFQSGVSTSPFITDVSGRGLGLAIVREKVERLGGSVALESRPGAGTAFRIVLPLMLANFQGVTVKAGGRLFIIPAINVARVLRVAGQNIRTVENRETIALDDEVVALVWLSDVLEMPRKSIQDDSTGTLQAVVLEVGTQRIAFRVEELVGEQEVLVKPLGPQLKRVRNVAGASVLGTGEVVPVLNVSDLLKSAVQRAPPLASVAETHAETESKSILVVEDSITSRSLLRNILELAGYRVTTAVDGVDAYTALKTGAFDLIVSDVEMPRMDGFGLTAKVRADKQLAALPVVLVTALGSREHRERGVDVGANAYIVKSSFDQNNLLEVIGRLV